VIQKKILRLELIKVNQAARVEVVLAIWFQIIDKENKAGKDIVLGNLVASKLIFKMLMILTILIIPWVHKIMAD